MDGADREDGLLKDSGSSGSNIRDGVAGICAACRRWRRNYLFRSLIGLTPDLIEY